MISAPLTVDEDGMFLLDCGCMDGATRTRLAKATSLGQVFTGTFNLTSIFLEDFAGFLQGFRFTLAVAIPAGTDLP